MYLSHIAQYILPQLEIIARAGGGGSSSGGGSGGFSVIAMVGYVPAHAVTRWFYKRTTKPTAIAMGSITGVLVTALFLFSHSFFLPLLVAIGAGAGVYSGTKDWLQKLFAGRKTARKGIDDAAKADPAWQELTLRRRFSQVFYSYQADWSNFALSNIQTYVTPRYFQHLTLMLAALHLIGRQNQVLYPKIEEQAVVAMHDADNNEHDQFTVAVYAKADDRLIDSTTQKVLYQDKKPFGEYWQFVRQGDQWLLDSITQVTANLGAAEHMLAEFAAQQGMFYSLDWGCLLLPARGRLFRAAHFERADINNHVIGQWNNLIVQLYTYIPDKQARDPKGWLIGQIALPKSYGGIIIQRRTVWNRMITPRGYKRYIYEWPEFTKRYSVFATDGDRLASFELLNPKFMAALYDKNLNVNIEVTDNIVYLYANAGAPKTYYPKMLEILAMAFKELKL